MGGAVVLVLDDVVGDQLIARIQLALAESFIDQATSHRLGSRRAVSIVVQCRSRWKFGDLLSVSHIALSLVGCWWVCSMSRTCRGASHAASGGSPIWRRRGRAYFHPRMATRPSP